MIGQPKPLASLSSTLLARKGTARPAMRSQGYAGLGGYGGQDDLGWNDMGEPYPPVPAQPVSPAPMHTAAQNVASPAIAPAPVASMKPSIATPVHHFDGEPVVAAPEIPAVVAQQAALVQEFATPAPQVAEPSPAPVADAPRKPRAAKAAGVARNKAAFTLRLDAERHLKLRLANALLNRSSQHIVTEALDAFLDSLPEVAALARRVPGSTK